MHAEVSKSSLGVANNAINRLIINSKLPSGYKLAKLVSEKRIEKYNGQLSDDILSIGYSAKAFDLDIVRTWLDEFYCSLV